MQKKAPTKSPRTSVSAGPEADPRFFPVAKAFMRMPGFSLMESKSGALRGLMLNGKSFGMSSHGRFILKLNEERATVLIEEGIGNPSPRCSIQEQVGRCSKAQALNAK
jgi:hypothetical protein